MRERERERAEDIKEEATMPFSELVLKMTHCHFCHVLFIRNESLRLAHIQGEVNQVPLATRRESNFNSFWTYFKTTTYVVQHIGFYSLLLSFSNLFYDGHIILCAILLYVLVYSFNYCILFPSLFNHSPLARCTLNLISDFHRKHSGGGAC